MTASVRWPTREDYNPRADLLALRERQEEDFRRWLRSDPCDRCGSPFERGAGLTIPGADGLRFDSELCRASYARIARGLLALYPHLETPTLLKAAAYAEELDA